MVSVFFRPDWVRGYVDAGIFRDDRALARCNPRFVGSL